MKISTYEVLKHTTRQVIYRHWPFPINRYFQVFNKLYHEYPFLWPDIIFQAEDNCYIHSNFIADELAAYRGKEIAVFNGRRLTVSWLPGALHSARGHVKTGRYHILIRDYGFGGSYFLIINKSDETVTVQSFSRNASTASNSNAIKLDGGFVQYSAIEPELRCLIKIWLDYVSGILNDTKCNFFLKNVIKLCDTELIAHAQSRRLV